MRSAIAMAKMQFVTQANAARAIYGVQNVQTSSHRRALFSKTESLRSILLDRGEYLLRVLGRFDGVEHLADFAVGVDHNCDALCIA